MAMQAVVQYYRMPNVIFAMIYGGYPLPIERNYLLQKSG